MRRRDVFELTRARPVTYRFEQAAGEALHLVLFVVTPGENADYRIRYRIEGAKPASREAAFFRRVTIPDGVLAGRGGDLTATTALPQGGRALTPAGRARRASWRASWTSCRRPAS